MKKEICGCLGLAVLFATLTFTPAFARNWNLNVNTHGDVSSCDSLDIYSDEGKVARAEDTITAPNFPSGLHLKAGERGGLVVRGSDRGDYSIKVCKAATARDQAGAKGLLRENSVNLQGQGLGAQGARGGDWLRHFNVDGPKKKKLGRRNPKRAL